MAAGHARQSSMAAGQSSMAAGRAGHVTSSMAAQIAGKSLPDSSRVCCRCNRNGRCRNCACCKERRRCVSCLPGRLGRCENYGVTSSSDESVFEKDSEDEPGTDDASEASDVAPSSGGECSPSFDVNNSQGFDAVGESDGPSSLCDFLPPFNMMCEPNFLWGDVTGEFFAHSVTCCYDEVVHWRKALFKIPLAKCGRAFVAE